MSASTDPIIETAARTTLKVVRSNPHVTDRREVQRLVKAACGIRPSCGQVERAWAAFGLTV